MAQLVLTIDSFSLQSTWTGTLGEGLDITYSTPTTKTATKSVGLSSIMAGSNITSAVLSGSTNGQGTSKAKYNSINKNITNSFSVSVLDWLSGLTSFGDLPIVFSFQAYGGTGGTGQNSRTSSFNNITLTIDYELPTSSGTLNKTTVDAGAAIGLTITPNQTGVTHIARWAFGGYNDAHTMAAGVVSDSLTVPMTWLAAIPNSTAGTASVTLETYKDGVKTGAVVLYFTITAPASVVPSIGGFTASPVGLDGVGASPWGLYVQDKSKARLQATGCVGAHGSSIVSYLISGGGFTSSLSDYTTEALPMAGNVTFTCKVTDSRGRTATASVTISVNAYQAPWYSTLSVSRCTSAGALDDMGTYIRILATYACSAVGSNAVSMTYSYRVNGTGSYPAAAAVTSGTAVVFGGGAISPVNSYQVQLVLSDGLTTVTRVVDVSSAKFLLHGMPGANGVGIGKAADHAKAISVPEDWTLYQGSKDVLASAVSGRNGTGADTVADCNAIWKSGFYDISNGANTPNGDQGWFWLLNAAHTSDNPDYRFGMQIAVKDGTNNFYARSRGIDGSGLWSKLWNNANLPDFLVNKLTFIDTYGDYITHESRFDDNGGYILFLPKSGSGNGRVIQYRRVYFGGELTNWVSNLYYADVDVGNWYVGMSGVYGVTSTIYMGSIAGSGWQGTVAGSSSTWAGIVRIFAPKSTAYERYVYVWAMGQWAR